MNIYADEGLSGTSTKKREAFNQMIADAEAGKINLIVTKSISRFSRSIIDILMFCRNLRARNPPVGVYFENEGIYTLNSCDDQRLSLISTFAEEESHTKSVSIKPSERIC